MVPLWAEMVQHHTPTELAFACDQEGRPLTDEQGRPLLNAILGHDGAPCRPAAPLSVYACVLASHHWRELQAPAQCHCGRDSAHFLLAEPMNACAYAFHWLSTSLGMRWLSCQATCRRDEARQNCTCCLTFSGRSGEGQQHCMLCAQPKVLPSECHTEAVEACWA